MERPARANRRRAPYWVRELSSASLHGLAGRLLRESKVKDLSGAQEWLWDRCINELEWRRRQVRPVWQSCSCELCVGPFDYEDLPT